MSWIFDYFRDQLNTDYFLNKNSMSKKRFKTNDFRKKSDKIYKNKYLDKKTNLLNA